MAITRDTPLRANTTTSRLVRVPISNASSVEGTASQSLRARFAEYRRHQLVTLPIDLSARRRILRGAVHRFEVDVKFATVFKFERKTTLARGSAAITVAERGGVLRYRNANSW